MGLCSYVWVRPTCLYTLRLCVSPSTATRCFFRCALGALTVCQADNMSAIISGVLGDVSETKSRVL